MKVKVTKKELLKHQEFICEGTGVSSIGGKPLEITLEAEPVWDEKKVYCQMNCPECMSPSKEKAKKIERL